MKNILITGANRGIGLEFTKQYLEKNNRVFATCRNPEKANRLIEYEKHYSEQLFTIKMDVASENSIKNAADQIRKNISALDVLINNAGTYSDNEKGLSTINMETMMHIFSVNTCGPVIVTKYLTDLLEKGDNPTIANLFSGMGFLNSDSFKPDSQYSYAASKSALNMCIKYMSQDLEKTGITVIGIGPGFVLTDMTKNSPVSPPLCPRESVSNMIKILESKTIKDTGNFFENDGTKLNI